MFEIGSRVEYQQDKKIAGVVKNIHTSRPFWRIICVKLDSGEVTWFTPVELATPENMEEYIDWLESENQVPYLHVIVHDILTSDVLVSETYYKNSLNYGLKLYIGITKGDK